MHAHCLPRLFLPSGTCTESWPQGCVGVRHAECWGFPVGHLGESADKHDQRLLDGFLEGIWAVVRIHNPWIPWRVLSATLPVSSHLLVTELLTQDPGWGERQMGFLGSILHSWGPWVHPHKLSLSSSEEIIGWEKSLLALNCAVLGERWCGRHSISFSYLLHCIQFFFFFFALVSSVLELLHQNLNFQKGSPINGWLSTTMFSRDS